MFGKKIKLFNLMGFRVSIDLSWIILAVLITWTLSRSLFPQYYSDLSVSTYWWMGVAGMVGLVFSIVYHEFCHSIVARQFAMPMKGITLFIFGGVAEMHDEPVSPKAEFLMAAAGPASSILLGGLLLGVFLAARMYQWPVPVTGVLGYVMFINFILAGFNLIPAFPLDGGRILRSILWGIKKDLKWATRICASFGSAFAIFLIVLGIFSILAGNFIGGLWWFLIGLFIKGASQGSYQNLLFRNILSGRTVAEIMTRQPVTIPPDITIKQAVEDYFYAYHHRMYPVVRDGRLLGCITPKMLQEYPRGFWEEKNISDIVRECAPENSIDMNMDAFSLLKKINSEKRNRFIVTENEKLTGIITRKDLMDYIFLRMDLEQ